MSLLARLEKQKISGASHGESSSKNLASVKKDPYE